MWECPNGRSNLERVGKPPAARGSDAKAAPRELLRWAPLRSRPLRGRPLAGRYSPQGHSALAAVCAAVLVPASPGWPAGVSGTAAAWPSQRQIDDRSGELRRALTELEIAQAETVRRLSMAVEFRDEDTGAHIERIGRFSTLLAEQVGHGRRVLRAAQPRRPAARRRQGRDPRRDPLKPGPLTPEERAIVETHAEEGHRLLRGSSSSILDMAATIALSHHEKWDGSGYPRGLAGEEIPIEGRIVAIADVFDALTSDRVYRLAFSVEEAVKMMREQRGKHFDPVLLDAFLEVLVQLRPRRPRAAALRSPTLLEEPSRPSPPRSSAATPRAPRARSLKRSRTRSPPPCSTPR